jgi:small-conductance mechanosensitive channel
MMNWVHGGLRVAAAFFISMVVLVAPALAQNAAPASPPPPEKVRQLLQLMSEPDVRQWLQSQLAPPAAAPPAHAGNANGVAMSEEMSVLSDTVTHTRHHFTTVSDAVMTLPAEVMTASERLAAEVQKAGALRLAGQAIVLFLIGLAAEIVMRHLINAKRTHRAGHEASAETELQAARYQFLSGVIPAVVNTIVTLIPLLVFDWPPICEGIAIAAVIALASMRLVIALGKLLRELTAMQRAGGIMEAGGDETDIAAQYASAHYWYRRSALFVIYFACGWAVIQILEPLGFAPGSRDLIGYGLGVGLLLIAVEAVWSRPVSRSEQIGARGKLTAKTVSWLLSVYFVLLWCLWVSGFDSLFWLGVYAALLPRALSVATAAIKALHDVETGVFGAGKVATVLLDRGVRALIIALAALWLGHMLGVGANAMMGSSASMVDRIARGVLGGIITLLAADLIWNLAKTYIDNRLAQSLPLASDSEEMKASRARLQTLLPIFRNILAVIIGIIAVMMVLSGLGIQIGPLIAGAGVVGVAVGFGAQTIVKDVISGIFYLWDDAFRIGDYIESGNHKGVVESFSLRSIKLRHQRGPLATVPFGSLGAVNNLNRDWAVDKIIIKVTYDTDLAKTKRIVKEIGQQLLQNEELAPSIIQTLKMKGVEQFGDYAIEIRLAITAKPGELSVIRRAALVMIKQAFDENGIQFAFPTVQVAKDGDAAAAAARQLVQMQAVREEPAA